MTLTYTCDLHISTATDSHQRLQQVYNNNPISLPTLVTLCNNHTSDQTDYPRCNKSSSQQQKITDENISAVIAPT